MPYAVLIMTVLSDGDRQILKKMEHTMSNEVKSMSLADIIANAEASKSRRSSKEPWSPEEDAKLIEALSLSREAGKKKASTIDLLNEANYFEGRTKTELWKRSIALDKQRIAESNKE